MTETLAPAADQSFADYLHAENAKESAIPTTSVDAAPAEPEPSEIATQSGGTEAHTETSQAAPVEPDAERNADGTFKAKSSSQHNREEWLRNKKLTAQLHEQQRQLDELRARVTDDVSPAPQAAHTPEPLDPSDPEPQLDQFLTQADPYAALIKAQAKWEIREAARQSQVHEARSAVLDRVEAFVADHPDYHDKLHDVADVIFSPVVLEAIADDELGPDVAYHLASHPEEARRIAALRPLEGVKAIGTILTRLAAAPSGSAPKVPVKSQAQPLIKPVSAAPVAPAATDPDPETTPFHDWLAIENAKDRKRRQENRGA